MMSTIDCNVSAERFYNIAAGSKCLVVDLRNVNLYNRGHLPFAISSQEYLSSTTAQLSKNMICESGLKIAFYDQNGGNISNQYTKLVKKCQDIALNKKKSLKIIVLSGGLDEFQSLFPHFNLVSSSCAIPPRVEFPSFIPIAEVYLGCEKSSYDFVLNLLGIQSVVNIGAKSHASDTANNGVTFKKFSLVDSFEESLEPVLSEAVEYIAEQQQQTQQTRHTRQTPLTLRKVRPVLVHCRQGISRSVSVVLALLIRKHGMSFDDALSHIKEHRPIANPNAGFVSQLQDLSSSAQYRNSSVCDNSSFLSEMSNENQVRTRKRKLTK